MSRGREIAADGRKRGGGSLKGIPQHVWNNEEPHMTAADVDLIEMTDSAVARRYGDVLELDIHVVFGYSEDSVSFATSYRFLPQLDEGWNTGGDKVLVISYLQSICLDRLGQK